ncbi:nucleotide-diphospho-sugar transferase-domain-containing protein [Pavlovales sp. CCMP2436]|nr:nucleotide-diphospho-sugar transferase-domain-containing protein [Pavlovales sp. CCMP2436]
MQRLGASASEDARFIIVTFATKGVMDFALNWVLHIRALHLPHMLGAMDDAMVDVCERWAIPVHAVHRDNPEDAHSRQAMSGLMGAGMANLRGSDKGFAGLGVLKTLFIQRLLKDGHDVLISDTDTAWFKDPRPIVYGRDPKYADFRHADLLISTDCIDSTDDESAGNSGCWYTPVQKNTGMMFFKANNHSITFVREWEERLVIYTTCPPEAGAPKGKCEGYNDQNLLNEMIEGRPLGSAVWHDGAKNQQHNVRRKEKCVSVFKGGMYGIPLEEGHTEGSRRVFLVCMPGKLERYVVGVLPTIEYANGHSFFVQQRFLTTGVWPTAVHVTFTWGDSAAYAYGKLQRMKDFGMWKLGSINRYNTPGRGALGGGSGGGGGGDGGGGGGDGGSGGGGGQREGADAGSEEEAVRRMSARKYLLVSADYILPAVVPYDKADYDQRAYQHVQWQQHVRNRLQHALALALALNRTVILPPFHCYCDRYFYRLEGCMIPGGHHATQLPFVCPFDHVFDSSHWYELGQARTSPAGRAFARLGFEGSLFGDQLRRAPQISNSRATLRVQTAGVEGAVLQGAGAAPLSGLLAAGSSSADIVKALEPLQHVHVLQVSLDDAQAIFGAFASKSEADDFNRLAAHLFGLRVAYCQKECRFETTMYESVKLKQRDPCVWLDGTDKLKRLSAAQ